MLIALSEDHPYVLGLRNAAALAPISPGKKWRACWRDFHTVSQEVWFDTESGAREFVFALHAKAMVIDPEKIGGCMSEALEYWDAIIRAEK